MPQSSSPLAPVQDTLDRLQSWFQDLQKTLKSNLKTMVSFLKNLIKAIGQGLTQFITVVGKQTVDAFLKAANDLLDRAEPLLAEIEAILQSLARALKLIAKAASPAAIVARLKSILKKIATFINKLLTSVLAFISRLNLMTPLLKLIDTFRRVLMMMFKWIGQVSGLFTVVKTLRAMLKKAATALKKHIKDTAEALRKLGELAAA